MKLRLREVRSFERPVVLRLPFRFGVVTLREAPQLFVQARIELENGTGGWGWAAELLAPKWFDKNPELSNEANFQQLRDSLGIAVEGYRSESRFTTPFDLFASRYRPQIEACARRGLNSLIACYGPALLDRAILDAVCRLRELSFFEAVRTNLPGFRPHAVIPDLGEFEFSAFLAGLRPLKQLHARHTVGLIDPLTTEELPAEQRISDGLPETLEEAVAAYGHTYFKIKVCGDLERDLPRLNAIAEVLDRCVSGYQVTLDGNEQYRTVEEFNRLLNAIAAMPELERFRKSILFVEQPLSRLTSLDADLTQLRSPLPVIIDESDDSLGAFPEARRQGYRGVSSKACKGFYKSILNAARCALWNSGAPAATYFMSAEDLTVQPGISLQQDLAIVSLLGLNHVERNGHHYVDGMQGAPEGEQEAFLRSHRDLYERRLGVVRLKIRKGLIQIGSLDVPGFASAATPALGPP